MFHSLRTQLGVIFLGFLILVGGSVAATFTAVHTQTNDATIINLAGRQRMLTQQMTWLSLAQPDSLDLTVSIQRFDQTLTALRDGGLTLDAASHTVTLPPAPDRELRMQLDEVAQTWAAFRTHLLSTDRSMASTAALQDESLRILAQLDAVVSSFETRAQAKILRLQQIQAIFLAAALLLLAWGYFVTYRRIIHPLELFGTAVRRTGKGHLSEPIPTMQSEELGRLARAFETMRTEVATAHDSLEARVAQRTHELTATFEFSQEIVTQLDLDRLLDSVTTRARSLVQAQAAALCLSSPNGEYLELVANSDGEVKHIGQQRSIQDGLPLKVVGRGQTAVTETRCSTCGFLQSHPGSQCAAAPLRVGENTLGALCVVHRDNQSFTPDETRALTLLANSAAIAVANARLIEKGQRQAKQAATLTERERLTAELHDNLAQTLSFLNLKTERVEEMLTTTDEPADIAAINELKQMKPAISTAYQQVRAVLTGLQEPLPIHYDLAPKLTACIDSFRQDTELSTTLSIVDESALALPRVTQMQALHIVREALTNIRRHAHANRVQVLVRQMNGEAHFIIEDDGCGFVPNSVESENHLGLVIMQTRAERSDGHLTVKSTPGVGTQITACFPLKTPDKQSLEGQL